MIEFKNSNQMKSYMKKEANRLNISISNVYHTFIARKLLERLSKTNNELILVKGSCAEIAYLGSLVRGITDVDLAALNGFDVNNDFINNILLNNEDEQIKFSLKKEPYITPTGIHKLSTLANFDVMKQDLNVDFQPNYNRLIEKEKRIFPEIFEKDEEFEIQVPSFEEYLAEKLCIIVESNKEDVLNTRVKDFYDIWKLLECNYNANLVEDFFAKMIVDRGKTDVDSLDPSFLNKEYILRHQKVWDDISKKYEFLDKSVIFEYAVNCTKNMLKHEVEHFERVRKL